MKIKEHTGQAFGRLVVLGRAKGNDGGYAYWTCLCACGNRKDVRGAALRNGTTTSCGCYWRDCIRKPKTHGMSGTIEYAMYKSAKMRAKRDKVRFELSVDDIIIPKKCPVFGVPLVQGSQHEHGNSPSLDRKDSSRGYVQGNVWVISHRANLIKSNATLDELKLLVAALEREI